MGDIIDFPTKAVRDRAHIEKLMMDLLSQSDIDGQSKNELTKRLVAIWDKFQQPFLFSFSLPESLTNLQQEELNTSIKEAFKLFEKSLHDYHNVLILDRMINEIKLFHSERSS